MLNYIFRGVKTLAPYASTLVKTYEVTEKASGMMNTTNPISVSLNVTQTIIINCLSPNVRFPVEWGILSMTLVALTLQPNPVTVEMVVSTAVHFYKKRYSLYSEYLVKFILKIIVTRDELGKAK